MHEAETLLPASRFNSTHTRTQRGRERYVKFEIISTVIHTCFSLFIRNFEIVKSGAWIGSQTDVRTHIYTECMR